MACVVFRCTHVKIRLFAYSGDRDRPFRVNVIGFGLLPESSVTMLRKTHPISGLATTADQLGKRTTPFVCDTDTTLEEFEITLPETVKVQTLPKPVLFEGPTIRFESTKRMVFAGYVGRKRISELSHLARCAWASFASVDYCRETSADEVVTAAAARLGVPSILGSLLRRVSSR